MELVDFIDVPSKQGRRRIQLLKGDLTEIPDDHRVDALVISAFPDDYEPTPNSLIGGLHTKGLSIAALARDPQEDLRTNFSCWISRSIDKRFHHLNFDRIVCFEPLDRGSAPELVGDIFRSLAPFVFAEPAIRSIALPIVAAGDQAQPLITMLEALLDACRHWLSAGMPLDVIKLVVRSDDALLKARSAFLKFRTEMADPATHHSPEGAATCDVFISYARNDQVAAMHLREALTALDTSVFMDTIKIETGAAWQQKIFDALDNCKATIALYSPEYVKSQVCKEEFNISWARQRDLGRTFIFPILIRDANLPTYMKMLNYSDCRVVDREKLSLAAKDIHLLTLRAG